MISEHAGPRALSEQRTEKTKQYKTTRRTANVPDMSVSATLTDTVALGSILRCVQTNLQPVLIT